MKTKRIFIGIFGRRNQGKSSLINAIAGQDIAIVSNIPGTTTDPVKKSIEVFGIGPVVFVDTAGIDDVGEMGEKRIKKTMEVLKTIDVAIVLISENIFGQPEADVIKQLNNYQIPFVIVHNKSDKITIGKNLFSVLSEYASPIVECSAQDKTGIPELIDTLVKITPPSAYISKTLLGDVVSEGDLIALVMPQDSEAPEGRLILPQVQLIRDILDNNAIAIGLQPPELKAYLQKQKPHLVITDSQVFDFVSKIVPAEIPLSSFSIILARSKGNFSDYLLGTPFISTLKDGDKILMMESCTHVTSCEDIGRHKIPAMLQKFTGKRLEFDWVSSLSPLPDLNLISMGIQCGACMVTEKQVSNRVKQLLDNNIPVSNYGMTIAYVTGIFDRVTEIFRK
ncbi:MAG: [FeFe] hydrogenase H-cluster maturation GTPase HydF [Bacteroidales bacterium]|nr:[FeFe] hydrogenase H-cluster maturation GTPase HydF [Bacteroidales bacterium]MDD4209456.1 [FeFe] hydrogenase H-cluster maturation GTPase HydF [Bacteroidales bacterium]